MRFFYLSFSLCVSVLGQAAGAAPSFPYTAYVVQDDVYVRSGPGSNFYPTDKLSRGTTVEVYRHDPGGWYAIRPPKRSFSWVSARAIQPTDNGLGRVTEADAPARVGSRFSNVRDVIQVHLDKGETVQILGERNVGGQTWYKIAPPAGEFRWMARRQLDRRPPDRGGQAAQTAADMPAAQPAPPTGAAPPQWTTARPEQAGRPSEQAASRGGSVQLASAEDQPAAVLTVPPQADRDQRPAPPANPIEDLQRIDHALSVMVAEEPSVWELSEIRHQTEAIARQAGSDRQQAEAERLLRKIARLEDIKARHDRLMHPANHAVSEAGRTGPDRTGPDRVAVAPGTMRADELAPIGEHTGPRPTLSGPQAPEALGPAAETAPLPGPIPASASASVPRGEGPAPRGLLGRDRPGRPATGAVPRTAAAARTPRHRAAARAGRAAFDSVGTLRPVVSRRRRAPRYALVDSEGTVVSFVSPGPGIDLTRYLGQRIGVAGKRSYIPEFRRTHVTARRVMALGDTTLR